MILFLILVVAVVGLAVRKKGNLKVAGVIAMNDFVLRGFCQKILFEGSPKAHTCDGNLYFQGELSDNYPDYEHGHGEGMHIIEPVWFLSPKQIEIIFDSDEFDRYWTNDGAYRKPVKHWTLPEFLESQPFLVAKILKESEKE